MKKMSQEKRNQLIIVGTITAAVLGLIYFFLIQPQYASLKNIARETKTADTKLAGIKTTIINANTVASDLAGTVGMVASNETDMATGDLYSWTFDTIRHFKQPYRIDIPDVGNPSVGEMDLLPSFPYKQIRFSISGTGYYHDLGKFIADFENNYPHARMVRLSVEPVAASDPNNEKLYFRMEIIALVKANPL